MPVAQTLCKEILSIIRSASLYDRDGDIVLSGNYIDDQLNGIVQIKSSSDGSVLEVLFKSGTAHGPARRFSARGLLIWVDLIARKEMISSFFNSL